MKRALIYNAAFPVLGGGERYTVALGDVIAATHDVTYAAPNIPDPDRLARVGFPPLEVEQMPVVDFPRASVDYDLSVFVAVDLPPASFSTHSILVVQFPRGTTAGSWARRRVRNAKLRRYQRVVYSEFVRRSLIERWGVDGTVIMPGIELAPDRTVEKENLILSIGRFVGNPEDNWTSKRQDVLIDAFSKLPPDTRASWRLVLAGGCSPSPAIDRYLDELRRRAAGLDVSIETNVLPERLADLQDRARLFWHASGFERPESLPEQAEHFGMSTAEAMSHGAIPLVYADGGQVEIVTDEVGRCWRSVPELVAQTTELISRSRSELDAVGHAARAAAVRFGLPRFEREVRELLERSGAVRLSRVPAPASAVRRTRWRLHQEGARVYDALARTRQRVGFRA